MTGLVRLLVIVLIAWLIYSLLRRWLNNTPSTSKDKEEVEQMVRCTYCGLHVPRQESYSKHGKYFCSLEHLQQDK